MEIFDELKIIVNIFIQFYGLYLFLQIIFNNQWNVASYEIYYCQILESSKYKRKNKSD